MCVPAPIYVTLFLHVQPSTQLMHIILWVVLWVVLWGFSACVVVTMYSYVCVYMYLFRLSVWPTLSSWESGCSRLCCWMAIGGGRGTASAPSSPSSSPQLCMPDEEDLDRVPLLNPSLRIRWREREREKNNNSQLVDPNQNGVSECSDKVCYPLLYLFLLPPVSHPVAWRRCRPSPSASRVLCPCSSLCRRGSSCACGRASSRGHLLCRSWAGARGWSATSLRCSQDVWGLVSCEDPGFGWNLVVGRRCWIQTRYLRGRKEREGW